MFADLDPHADPLDAALAEHRDLRARLVALTDGADEVLRPGTLVEACRAICSLASRVLPADGYAVWAFDREAGLWDVIYSAGLSQSFVIPRVPGKELAFAEPLIADDLQSDLLAARDSAYRAEGIRSLITVPLPIEGVRRGALVAYYREPHRTSPPELQVAVALGHLAAAAIASAEARARQETLRLDAERQSRRMAFLAEASRLLSTLDYEASFRRLAEIAVPDLGDWCAIDLEQDGWLTRVAIAHPDPAMRAAAEAYARDYPTQIDEAMGAARVLRSGEPQLHPEITDEMLARGARDAQHLERLRALHIKSAILAPLIARSRTLGVLTLVSSTPGRRYDESDLRFVEEVARRAATAIDNAQLYQDAQRANRAKDQFLALLSHELRTPLNAIMGWTQVLLNSAPAPPDGAQLRRGLEIIKRNARLQANLVDGLLDVARVATGGLPLTRQPVEATEAVQAAVEAIRPVAAQKQVQVSTIVVGPPLRLLADPNRLQQVLGNLLSNAVKFSEAEAQVSVEVRRSGRWCEIVVSDAGAGIAPEFLPHVFERFRQGDSTTTRQHGGLGLGLWLVQELVRAHGGTVLAESAGRGAGATFTVRLPAID